MSEAKVPVIGHLEGLVHIYVDAAADPEAARRIVMNAKLRRTGVCGAVETLLFDRAGTAVHLAAIVRDLLAAGWQVRGAETVRGGDARGRAAAGSGGREGPNAAVQAPTRIMS